MPLTVNLRSLDGADAAQRQFIERAVALLGAAAGAPDFLAAFARAEYVETRWAPAEGPERCFTPVQIATRIGEGRERGCCADQSLDFHLAIADDLSGPGSGKTVLGSTALGASPIRPARWFVERCRTALGGRGDAVNFASHLMHEWCHLSGFYHWPDNKARGDTAYVAGRLVREALAAAHGAKIDPAITALMHDRETDCGCRGNRG